MKKLRFLFFAVLLSMFASCDLETSDNGDLDGFWHLVSVDTWANSANPHTDLSEVKIFWAFQMKLLQLRGTGQELYMRFLHENNTLRLYDPHLKDREKGDPIVDESTLHFLFPYGINSKEETFQVIQLDGDEMVLQNSTLRLSFCKM